MNAEKTGRLIHDLRTKKGMTQQGLAELLRGKCALWVSHGMCH